jgi:hypothetical protein
VRRDLKMSFPDTIERITISLSLPHFRRPEVGETHRLEAIGHVISSATTRVRSQRNFFDRSVENDRLFDPPILESDRAVTKQILCSTFFWSIQFSHMTAVTLTVTQTGNIQSIQFPILIFRFNLFHKTPGRSPHSNVCIRIFLLSPFFPKLSR